MFKNILSSKTLLPSLLVVSLASSCGIAQAAPASGWWLSLAGAAYTANVPAGLDSTWTGHQVVPLHYSPNSAGTALTGLIGYGYQFVTAAEFMPAVRLGAQYQYQAPITIKGDVPDDVVGAYTYQNKISSNVLWLDGQADLMKLGHFTPYVEAGIGAAYNTFSNYSETYNADVSSPDRMYGNKSTIHGAYKLGVGINYALNVKHGALALGLFYNYVDLGRVSSAAANIGGSPQLSENINGNQYGLALRYNI